MDRYREGRRRGPVSAPRRPRATGFKDSAVVDDEDIMDDANNSRLRERAKKESSGNSSPQGTSSGHLLSRNKRKHQLSHEVQVQAHSIPADDRDQTTEDTEMAVSEEDDDLPPLPLSWRPGKLKLQEKAFDKGDSVDLSAVPRKARTAKSAIMKRAQDSSPQQATYSPRQRSLATDPEALSTVPSFTNPILEPGRRMKPNRSKFHASKVPKVSKATTISEQEVEVAEALYDLARIVPNRSSSSVSEAKYEVKLEPMPEMKFLTTATTASPPASTSFPAINSPPAQACTPASPVSGPPVSSPAPVPVSSSSPADSTSLAPAGLEPQTEAPKRKRPRMRAKTEDRAPVLALTAGLLSSHSGGLTSEPNEGTEQASQHIGSDRVQVKVEPSSLATISSTMATAGSPHTSAAVSNAASLAQLPYPVDKKTPATVDEKPTKIDSSNHSTAEKLPVSASIVEQKNVLVKSPSQRESQADNELPGSNNSELGKRLPHSPPSNGAHPCKCEIDLMVPSQAIPGVIEMSVEADGLGFTDSNEKTQKAVVNASIKNSWLDRAEPKIKESFDDKDKDAEVGEGRATEGVREQDVKADYGNQVGKEIQRVNVKELERGNEKVDITKQPQNVGKNVKADTRLQKLERTAVSSILVSAPSTSSSSSRSIPGPTLPISMGLAGWPGGLPLLGYYSPAAAAAAAWPAGASVIGPLSVVNENSNSAIQVPSIMFPGAPQPCKRCSIHVYIAYFIDWQQRMQQHPIWATMYGNTAAELFGTKPYNLNMPLPPADAIHGGGGLIGVSGGTVVGPGSRFSGLGLRPLIPSTCIDVLTRKISQQPAQAVQQQPTLPLQAAACPMGGNVPSIATGNQAGAGTTATLIGGSSGAESTPPIVSGAGSVVEAGVGTTNATASNATAVQFQYLQAMIQQTGIPFSFPPPHFGPPVNGPPGHIAQQQATQFFGNPFYNTSLMQPHLHLQQGHAVTANVSAGLISLHKQQQGMSNLQTSGSLQQQTQPPASPSQYQQQHPLGTSPQHLQQANERECSMGREKSRTTESKLPDLQNSIYSKPTPNMNPPSVLTPGRPALPVHLQDVCVTSALGGNTGKQAGKLQHQQPQASGQLQGQQQLSMSLESEQRHVVSQHHAASPVLQMNSKGLDTQGSQLYSAMSMGNITGSSVDPGPFGLAPVADAMAPQGHAVLKSIADSMKGHSWPSHLTHPVLDHQHSVSQGQQQLLVLMQKAGSSGNDDRHTNIDESSYFSSNQLRDPVDDRKIHVKQVVPAALSRVGLEVSPNAEGSPTVGNSGGLTVSQTASSPCGQREQSSGRIIGSAPSANENLNPVIGRSKAGSNVIAASSTSLGDISLSLLADQTMRTTFNKVSAPCYVGGNQSLRHGAQHAPQHKFAQRATPGSAVPVASSGQLPTIPAAAAMTKHQGQPRSQQPSMNAQSSRLSPAASGTTASSSIPSHPLPPVSKSSGAAVSKNAAAVKGSFPVSQRQNGGTPPRRSGPIVAPTSGSILGPSPMGQNTPAKVMQQQSHHSMQQQHFTQPLQQQNQVPLAVVHQHPARTNQLQAQPLHKRSSQFFLQQQQQQQQQQQHQQFFQQHHQQQQSSHSQAQSATHTPLMMSSTQQQSLHPVQQQMCALQNEQQPHLMTEKQVLKQVSEQQQVLKNIQHPQQVLQSPQGSHMPAFLGVAANGGLSLSQANLTLETCSNRRNMNSDGILGQAAGSRTVTLLKSTGSHGGPFSAVCSRSGNNEGTASSNSQMASSNIAISVQQQTSMVGTNIYSLPYLRPASNSGPTGKPAEEKLLHEMGKHI